jgi:glucans biosynthesis protein C
MNDVTTTRERRHDLDWLRVLAIILLLYFHTAMIFTAEWGWHIKNAETSNLFLEFNYFLSRFRMAVLFLVSGVGTAYALGHRGARRYLRERTRRLLVPLVFGILVIVPPQIYIERIAGGETFASFINFWPSTLRLQPYPAGNTSWHHLWFVAYLLMYSVAALPLFLWWRSARTARVREAVDGFLAGRGIYLLGLPLAVVMAALAVRYPGPQNVVDDWARLLFYFLIFIYGFVLCRADAAWRGMEEGRRTSLGLAMLSMLFINYLRWNGLEPGWRYDVAGMLWIGLGALNSWFWVLAIIGYGRRYLSFRNRLLDYANEGIYPFYILHQTVIVVLGFYVVQTSDGILAKFLFTSTLSLLMTVAIYEYGVRPFALTRFLFGMKPAAARPALRMERARPVRRAGVAAGIVDGATGAAGVSVASGAGGR